METLYYSMVPSPVGPLTIAVNESGAVVWLGFGTTMPKWSDVEFVHSSDKTDPCLRKLDEYFSGSRRQFTIPVEPRGTEFQQSCWRALCEIPFGETRSYAELAQAVGRPKASRAVGMANHDNPIAIIIPCHRVIASDGTLGGYGGGLDAKRWLLQLEGARWRSHHSRAAFNDEHQQRLPL
jgi:methylated-DNA-[protein]-cysteine S-methyltransferase